MEVELVKEIEVNMEQIGPQGYSAYEVYVKNGGTLLETEWLASLKGDTGEKGDKGDSGSVKFIVVIDLPTENIETDAIYIKPLQSSQEQNIYEEFIYVNGNWESLGTPKVEVDLSNYYTKNEVGEITGELTNLGTENKDNLVSAINEVVSNSGNNLPIYEISIDNAPLLSKADNIVQLKSDVVTKLNTIVNDAYTKEYNHFLILANCYNKEYSVLFTNDNGANLLNKPTRINFYAQVLTNRYSANTLPTIYNQQLLIQMTWSEEVATVTGAYYYHSFYDLLTITNTATFTPTKDYQPATKLYVDTAIATLKAELTGGTE